MLPKKCITLEVVIMYKVLHVTYSTDSGGIGSVILNYYANINKQVFHFDLAQCEDYKGTAIKQFEDENFRIYYIGNKTGKNLFKHIHALLEVLRNERYDVLHVHTAHTSWVDLMVGLLCGVKKRIVHAHNAERDVNTIKQKIRIITGRILLEVFSTDKIACGRDAAIYMFGRHALSNKKTSILPNAIDMDRFRFDIAKRELIRKEFGIKDEELVFGTVGRLSYEKNQRFLLDILKSMGSINERAFLFIVGEGTERDALEEYAKEINLNDLIIFTGNRIDVDALMCAFDVFVLPSLYEGFPVTAVEAKATGLPVVLANTITDELQSYGDFLYLSLSDGTDVWAKKIVESKMNINERENNVIVGAERLDIRKTASLLEKIYLQ